MWRHGLARVFPFASPASGVFVFFLSRVQDKLPRFRRSPLTQKPGAEREQVVQGILAHDQVDGSTEIY